MTKKYIDADKLKAEIEKRAKFHDDAIKACVGLNDIAITHSAGWKEDTELLTIINSLQQEQSEVDLEKELKNKKTILLDLFGPMNGEQSLAIRDFARYFYELGRKGGSK